MQLILVIITGITVYGSYGQNDSSFVLDEVAIVGLDLSRFGSGTLLETIEPINSGGLAEVGRFSTIHFKNYGNQQLSTITFRGTSASHTNVVWNGIQVNSPTLGQTDFSVWPMFLMDKIFIQHGGGGSLFGSGAIGGSIIVDNSKFHQDSLFTAYVGSGSFGEKNGGIKLQFNVGRRLNLESKGYMDKVDNDFPLDGGGRQTQAEAQRRGFSQKIRYSYKNGRIFSEIGFTENDRNIQPTSTSASRSTLITRNFRGVINNRLTRVSGNHDFVIGLNSDKTIFNDSSITNSYRFTGTYSFDKDISSSMFFRIGGTYLNEWAKSENFEGTEIQDQVQVFTSLTWFPMARLGLTTNLREVIFNRNYEFIPSIGVEYYFTNQPELSVLFRTQASKDFRIPTFNDLFWRPGGNPNLLSERSKNIEGGFDVKLQDFKVSVTGFHSNINDWIQWRPVDGIWSPRNLRNVITKGIESNISKRWLLKNFILDLSTGYTFVRSEDQGLNEKNQLPYVPEHELVSNLLMNYGQYGFGLTGNYTGVRYTTLTNSLQSEVDAFFLLDASLSRSFTSRDFSFSLQLQTKNILDTNYQVVKNHAMPGRSFLIELITKF